MDGLVHLESYINSSEEKRKKSMSENKSPWSSGGSGSTSPLPNRLSLFDKSYSGGSTNSLGSSPGTEVRTLTNQSSLTVPDVNITKVNRSTSPFHFRSGRNKEKKRLEKQAHASEEPSSQSRENCLLSLSSQSSIGTSFETDQNNDQEKQNEKKTKNSFFRRRRKDSSPFSLNLMRKKSSEKSAADIPCTAYSTHLHPDFNSDSGFSPPRNRSASRSPTSPNAQCKCRRCSILHLEECEPKEMNALFKFLRKSKVGFTFLYLSLNTLISNTQTYLCKGIQSYFYRLSKIVSFCRCFFRKLTNQNVLFMYVQPGELRVAPTL